MSASRSVNIWRYREIGVSKGVMEALCAFPGALLCASLPCGCSSVSFIVPSLTHVHWVNDAIQPSHPVTPFSSCPQFFPASGSFPKSWLFTSWPNYWSFSYSISSSNEYSGLISLGLTGLTSLLSKGLSRVFSSTTIWLEEGMHTFNW